ncbi:MAG: phosphate ABC transporter substrate-binding protein, PhoT family [Ruminococcaceae bacterium]|nr:phosphate ABC transporter substrate-binding protein, PhoT family [Oscillospiraceae bacterium]
MKRLLFQIAVLTAVILLFAGFNASVYVLLTRRLANNFSDTSQAKMVDVAAFLPFEEGSDLAHIDTDFSLEGELPVLDGAAALVPVYASIIDAVYPEGSVTYEGGVFSDDNYYGENFAPDSKMQYKNTVRGYKAIVDGDTDILFCAAPSAEQRAYAEEQGVELVYVPVGLEAFVFFVNRDNPVEDLTVDEIRAIYAGDIRNWKSVGGENRVINPVTRLEGSGSQSMMDAFMGDTPIGGKSPFSLFGGAIGFSFRYYLDDMVDNAGVKMLSVNGVYPSRENIRARSYPIIAQFYAIYRADNGNENIPRLIDWILSAEGQTLIEECGYTAIGES